MDESNRNDSIQDSWIKNVIRFPVFENIEKTRTAKILVVVLWSMIVLVSGLILTWIVTEKTNELGPYAYLANAAIICFALVLLILIYRGYVMTVGMVFTVFIWANITFQAFTSDGIRGSVAIIYMTVMVLASLVIGWKASIGFAILSIGFVWILAHTEVTGSKTFQIDSPYEVALETSVIFVFAAILLMLTTTGLINALKRARESERFLKKTNLALHDNLKELANREEALRKSEEKYRELVQNANSIIMRLDIRGRFTFFNEFAEKFFGYSQAEVMGKNVVGTIIPPTGPSEKEIKSLISGIMNHPDQYTTHESENLNRSGEQVWIAWTYKGIHNRKGKLSEILCIGNDLTERKQLELKLQQSQKIEAIGRLAGGIAHDFNNILSGISGYSQLIEVNLNHPEKVKRQVTEIRKGAQRAAELVQQILTFSRKTEYQKRPIPISNEVNEALSLLRSSIPSTIEIETQIRSESNVLADPTRIHQLIMNLGTNAYQAMRKTGGRITVFLTDIEMSTPNVLKGTQVPVGSYVKLEVSDTGCGMDESTMANAFEPYFTTKQNGKGTGLGLALVQAIVEEHDGFLDVRSTPAIGTDFGIYFPIVKEITDADVPVIEKAISLRGNEKILVVDDEEAIRQVYKEFLEKYGYVVSTCNDGVQALREFKKRPHHFDVIVTDMTMPGMTGEQLALKLLKIRPDIPIILCTGFSEDISSAAAAEIGIRKFVQKPVASQKLIHMIRDIMARE